jgi:hypothetical protein
LESLVAPGNLVARWKCDDNLPSTVVLNGIAGGNGTSVRNTADMHVTGKIDGALQFNGTNDYVDTNGAFESIFQDSFSINFWCKPKEGVPARLQTFCGNLESHGYIECNLQTTGLITFSYATENDSVSIDFSHVFNAGPVDWFLFTATIELIDSNNIRISLYKNGVLQNSVLFSLSMSDYTGGANLYIGALNDAVSGPVGNLFSGFIDDVRIYNKALSADEVEQLYNETGGANFSPVGLGYLVNNY